MKIQAYRLVILALIISLIALITVRNLHGEMEWTRGRTGKVCYPKGMEHGNIDLKYALNFTSLELCQESINE